MIYEENLKRAQALAAANGATLIAATKTQSKQTIDSLMSMAPEIVLGENRAQELTDKYDERYTWHFIGRLQVNKVKYVVGRAKMIHSLDRIELAREIERQCEKKDIIMPCLVEVNVAGEQSKGGIIGESTLFGFFEELTNYPHISVEGLMAVMPAAKDRRELEGYYARLRDLYEKAKTFDGGNICITRLSAGMSGDFETALEYGANMIRLGRYLFGEREYKN